MRDDDQTRPTVRPQATDEHFAATGALSYVLDHPDSAILIDSNPNPMFVTVDDDEFSFWCFDYSKKCQVRYNPEDDSATRFDKVVDELHGYANSGYGIDVVDRDMIDDDPKPVATSLGEFE